MPRTQIPPLKERKIQEELREQKIQAALTSRNKILENVKREKKQKKKTVSELYCWLNIAGIEGKTLRPVNTYVPKSHNLEKQLRGLLNHLFVQYPVPGFLYDACLKDDSLPFKQKQEIYRKWFVILAQGGSFPKLVKEFMTSKEAFLFLSAPAGNRIHENVWWAKMKVAGLPVIIIEKLIERIFTHYFFDDTDGRLVEVIQFYARYHSEMDKVTFGEVTDFLVWKLREDREFRLKGRTVSSVIKLTNEWHLLMQKAKLGHNIEWKGLGLPDWKFEAKDTIWLVVELRNNRELMNEGRKQRHCVYSYVNACVSGNSAVFTMRCGRKVAVGCTDDGKVIWGGTIDQTCLTIEVNRQRTVVQVRGRLNRLPNAEEKRILRYWTGEKGLTMSA